jgi:hypothetical protein
MGKPPVKHTRIIVTHYGGPEKPARDGVSGIAPGNDRRR